MSDTIEKITRWTQAEKEAKNAIKESKFFKWLFSALDSKNSPLGLDEFRDGFTRLKYYRGTGPKITIEFAKLTDNKYVFLELITDWGEDSIVESEVYTRKLFFWIPTELFDSNATLRMFELWAEKRRSEENNKAIEALREKAKKFGISLLVRME